MLLVVLLSWVIQLMQLAILARVILSWIPGMQNGFTAFIFNITEPVLKPIRTLLSKISFFNRMMIDFSPIAAFILLYIIEEIIARGIIR